MTALMSTLCFSSVGHCLGVELYVDIVATYFKTLVDESMEEGHNAKKKDKSDKMI